MKQATLKQDVTSYGKGSIIYAKKGDKVTVISIRANVAIVELKGNRFTTNLNNLNIY